MPDQFSESESDFNEDHIETTPVPKKRKSRAKMKKLDTSQVSENINDNPIYRIPPYKIDSGFFTALNQTWDWGIIAQNIPDEWKEGAMGEGIHVCVCDTGVDVKHPDLPTEQEFGFLKDFTRSRFGVGDVNSHGCVSPDCLVHTSFCGVEEIETLYNRLDIEETEVTYQEGTYLVKDTSNIGIKTYSLDAETQEVKISDIINVQKLPINNEIVKITLDGHIEYKLTPWHPVYLLENKHSNVYEVIRKRADEVIEGDRFIFPKKGEDLGNLGSTKFIDGRTYCKCNNCSHKIYYWKHNLPQRCKKCNFEQWSKEKDDSIEITSDLAWLCGIVLTDGHIPKKVYRIEICSHTKSILDRVIKISNDYNWNFSLDENRVLIYGTEPVFILTSLGVPQGSKTSKEVLPEWVGKSPKEVIAAFIAGVIDGDGSIGVGNKKNRITTAGYEFAKKMCALMNSMGISTSMSAPQFDRRTDRFIKSTLPCYKIAHASLTNEIIDELAHPKKKKRSQLHNVINRKARRVCSVTREHYNGYFYDFTIKDYHNYLANGHFVSNTHCTGIVGARANGFGIQGLAPKCILSHCKILGDDGSGASSWIAAGIRYAADNGAKIISLSIGGGYSREIDEACSYAVNKKCIIFAAAGNSGYRGRNTVDYPGAQDNTICIGSFNSAGNISNFSSGGPKVDFAFPGEKILSTVPKGRYVQMSGTCLEEGSMVYTVNGPCPIEAVNPGTVVYAYSEGELVTRPVTQNHYRGTNDVFELKTPYGRHANLTPTHEVLAVNKKKKEIEWVEAQNICSDHRLLLPRKMKTQVNPYLDSIITFEMCWLLGFFAGDGWISETNRSSRINFATGDKDWVIQKFSLAYENIVGKRLKQDKNGSWCYDDSTIIAAIIECLGFKEKAKTKTVPMWLFNLPHHKQKAFYEGYTDADGHRCNEINGVKFECTSKTLIDRMSHLMTYWGWSHGMVRNRTRLSKAPNSKKPIWSTSYMLNSSEQEIRSGWSNLGNNTIHGKTIANDMGIDTDQFYLSDCSVTETGGEQVKVYDLSVPNADCFVTNGCITHNSMATPQAAGLAALVLSTASVDHQDINQAEFLELMKQVARDQGSTGKDDRWGWGIPDASKLRDSITDKELEDNDYYYL